MMTLNVHVYRTLHFDENYHGDDNDDDDVDDNHDDNTEHSGASSL